MACESTLLAGENLTGVANLEETPVGDGQADMPGFTGLVCRVLLCSLVGDNLTFVRLRSESEFEGADHGCMVT